MVYSSERQDGLSPVTLSTKELADLVRISHISPALVLGVPLLGWSYSDHWHYGLARREYGGFLQAVEELVITLRFMYFIFDTVESRQFEVLDLFRIISSLNYITQKMIIIRGFCYLT